jgi:hypothetical protein
MGLVVGWRSLGDFPWPDTRSPLRSLPDSYVLAMSALGVATNQYHCISAKCDDNDLGGAGRWVFTFCSTNGHYKYVSVSMQDALYGDGEKEGDLAMPNTRVWEK